MVGAYAVGMLLQPRVWSGYRVIFPSSGTVYLSSLGAGVKQIDESIPMNPSSVYAATKASCEFMGRAYAKRYGFEFICLRDTGGLYSPSRYCSSDSPAFPGSNIEIRRANNPMPFPESRLSSDFSRAREQLGYQPDYPIDKVMEDYGATLKGWKISRNRGWP